VTIGLGLLVLFWGRGVVAGDACMGEIVGGVWVARFEYKPWHPSRSNFGGAAYSAGTLRARLFGDGGWWV
jgi:hypothetical protein